MAETELATFEIDMEVEKGESHFGTVATALQEYGFDVDSIRRTSSGKDYGVRVFDPSDGDGEKETYALEDARRAVYDRVGTYGIPEDNFGTIAGLWNEYLIGGGISDPNLTRDDVAYLMILVNVARAANGVYKRDVPVDIAGYAENAARIREGDDD